MNKFDEFIIWERPCNPGLVFIGAEAVVAPHKKEFGYPWVDAEWCFFSDGMVRAVWNKEELTKNGVAIARLFANKNYYEEKMNRYRVLTDQLFTWYRRLDEVDMATLEEAEFFRLQREFYAFFLEWWGFAQVAEPVAIGCETLLRQSHSLSQAQMSALTTPTTKSYTTVEEEKIFALAMEVLGREALKKFILFEWNETNTHAISAIAPDFFATVKAHTRNYYWMQNSYAEVKILSPEYFIERIRASCQTYGSVESIEEVLRAADTRLSQYKQAVIDLENELNFTDSDRRLVELIDLFAFFQDERKAISIHAHQYLGRFIAEVARRAHISVALAFMLLPAEYELAIDDKFPLAELKTRQNHMALLFTHNGYKTYAGNVSREKEVLLLGTVQKDINGLEGMRAMGGTVVGRVRKIMKVEEISEMKNDEILVATMTSPDFVVAMKKASAIVTDEGGVTCHAAVISRELGIPCIIGTKLATRVLQTGDLIEVRANHGLVRVLERI